MRLTDPRNGKQLTIDIDLAQRWGKEFSDFSGHECDHERQELRRGTNRGGNPVIRMQCLDCGQRVGNPVKRPANADELPELNDTIHDDYNAAHRAAKEKVDKSTSIFSCDAGRPKNKGIATTDKLTTPTLLRRNGVIFDSVLWTGRKRFAKVVDYRPQRKCIT